MMSILSLLALVSAVSATTQQESLRLSLGQDGLDFASDVSYYMIDELQKVAARGLKLPDIHGDVTVRNLKLSKLELSKPDLSIVPNTGLKVTAPSAYLKVTGGWQYGSGWFSVSGSITLTTTLDVGVTAGIVADMNAGRFATQSKGCVVSYRSFDIDLHNAFYSWIVSFFEDTIQSEIKKAICGEIDKVLRTTLNGLIASLPHQIDIPNVMSVKFGPDADPTFASGHLDLPARVTATGQSFPFSPTGISGAMLPGYMACLLLSDYTLNTASYAALSPGKISEQLPNQWVSASDPLLNTAFYKASLPSLYSAYPDQAITYKIVNSQYPSIQFLSDGIVLSFPVKVTMEVAGAAVLEVSVASVSSGVVTVTGGSVNANITSVTHTTTVLDSKIGEVTGTTVDGVMDTVLGATVIPQVNAILNKGFVLPIKDWVLLQKSKILTQDNYLEICADVDLTDKAKEEIKKIIDKLIV